MTNYVHEGKTLTLIAPYAVLSGGGAKVGGFFGVASNTYASGDSGEFDVVGVYDLSKDASVFAQGDTVYWDNTAKLATSTSSANTKIGYAELAQLTGDAAVRVRLIPS